MKARVLDSVIREAAALAAESAAGSAADADLLRRFIHTKDEAAFAELLRRHARLVWAVCRQSLPTEADAEDAFQAVFLALARGANRVHDPAAVAGWLHATAVRVAAFARRSAARRKSREQAASVAEAQHPVSDQAWANLLAAVHDEVARLPEALRAAFVVCDLEGVPQAEAAARLGWKPGTLTGRLCQARQRLLARLTRRGLAPAGGVIGCGVGAGTTAAVPPGLIPRAVGFAANPATIPTTVTVLASRITEGVMTRTKLMLAGLMVAGAVGLGTGAVVLSQDPATGSTTGTTSTDGTTGTTSTTNADALPGEGAQPDPGGRNVGPSTRARVEHKLVDLKDDSRATLEAVLTAQGNQGWEFCSVQRVTLPGTWVPPHTPLVAVFKRPVPPPLPQGPTGTGTGGTDPRRPWYTGETIGDALRGNPVPGGSPAGGVPAPAAAEDIHLIPVKNAADPQILMHRVIGLSGNPDGISAWAADADARVIIVKGTAVGVAKLKALVEKLDLPPAKKQ